MSIDGQRKTTEELITEPTEMDVLCSKDTRLAKHPGNIIFRERIKEVSGPYASASSKQDKMKITRDIVAYMQSKHGSRFLKKTKEGGWVQIKDQTARDKVSHALRFAAKHEAGDVRPPPPQRFRNKIDNRVENSAENFTLPKRPEAVSVPYHHQHEQPQSSQVGMQAVPAASICREVSPTTDAEHSYSVLCSHMERGAIAAMLTFSTMAVDRRGAEQLAATLSSRVVSHSISEED